MQLISAFLAKLVQVAQLSGAGLGILAGAMLVYVVVAQGLRRLECRRYLPGPLVTTLRRIAFWLVAVASVVLLLQSLGVLQSVFAAVTGVFALLAIGFVAVWSVLSNTLCSLILMILRPFRIGDTLGFPPDSFRGKVVNFNMVFTTLETDEGLLLQVPNNMFFQRPIERKKGKTKIGLADQLYEPKNATIEPSRPQPMAPSHSAAVVEPPDVVARGHVQIDP